MLAKRAELSHIWRTGNSADQGGGAIFQTDAASSITFSVFRENSGGAVYRNSCRGFFINCSFINNTARQVCHSG
jgi:hypothetical protein